MVPLRQRLTKGAQARDVIGERAVDAALAKGLKSDISNERDLGSARRARRVGVDTEAAPLQCTVALCGAVGIVGEDVRSSFFVTRSSRVRQVKNEYCREA